MALYKVNWPGMVRRLADGAYLPADAAEVLAALALDPNAVEPADPPPLRKLDHQTFTAELQTTASAAQFIFSRPLDPATGYMAEAVVIAVADQSPFDRATWKAGIQAVRINGGAILDGQGFIPPWPIKSAGATSWNVLGSVSGNNFRVAVIGENGRAINWQIVLSWVRFNDEGLVG